jgi:DNA mismatch repair protein MLH3
MGSPSSRGILALERPARSRLRSAVIIPTFTQILNELVQNALDAGASRIECWISLEKGSETIKVEDDGHGIDTYGLDHIGRTSGEHSSISVGLGQRQLTMAVSSKDRTDGHLGPTGTYGFRGEGM